MENVIERTFTALQIIPPIFSRSIKGCAMFKRFFLYRYCFEEEIEIDDENENYVAVKQVVGGKHFWVYTDSEIKLNDPQKEKHQEGGLLCWGDFVKDLEKFTVLSDYDFCECEDRREKTDKCYEYKIHTSTAEKYFSIIYLMCEIAGCKCQLRYWIESLKNKFFLK